MVSDGSILAQYIADQRLYGHNQAIARRWAVQRYQRLFWVGTVARAWARLTGRPTGLQKLCSQTGDHHYLGLRDVALNQITGSEGRADDFDVSFRPRQRHSAERWVSIAVARRRGISLPPVTLIQVGERYFVRDGHHRLSVAAAIGQATIDAEVISAA